jgi:hypothetical protein
MQLDVASEFLVLFFSHKNVQFSDLRFSLTVSMQGLGNGHCCEVGVLNLMLSLRIAVLDIVNLILCFHYDQTLDI